MSTIINISYKSLRFIGVILIFISYYLLSPMDDKSKNLYELQAINVTSENTSASLVGEKYGTIFIHPGIKKPTGAIFKFNKNAKVLLSFSIRKGSQVGDIAFSIIKNGKEIKQLIVTAQQKQPEYFSISIKTLDKLEIWADKHGSTAEDWGNIELEQKVCNFNLKNFLIPFLWLLLFIYLLGKNQYYIGLNVYIGFLIVTLSEKQNFGLLSFEQLLTYTEISFAITFLFILLYQEFSFLKRYKIAMLLSYIISLSVYIIPLSFAIYAFNYHLPVTNDILVAIFQSNTHESIEYITDYIAIKYIVFFIFITILIGFLLYMQETIEIKKSGRLQLILFIIILFSMASVQVKNLRLPNFLIKGVSAYSFELKRFKQLLEKRKTGNIKYKAVKKEQGETYIIIIGESLNKAHMGIYGYIRKTTPNLTKMYQNGEITRFNNIYSNHTHTVLVLTLALTEANQYNHKKFYDSLSIIEILKKADIQTYWLTNQPLYSIYDSMVSIIGTSADHVIALNTNLGATQIPTYDGPLINKVKKVLDDKSDKNRVLFIHLGGSHSTYSTRYPNHNYSTFTQKPKLGIFGRKASLVNTLNSYDNSVFYNDYVVSSILKLLQKDKSAMALSYMSDHADDVINMLGHNSAMFTYTMTQIPMLFWFSDTYKKRYSRQYKTLQKHTNTLFSNDLWYDTLIGLMNIKTDHYNASADLTSESYKLDPSNALVLHGKKHYIEKENTFYWQKKNINYLQKYHLLKKVIPSHVNTLGKYNDIKNCDIKSYEVDVNFQEKPEAIFRLGVNTKKRGMSLEEFLIHTKNDQRAHFTIYLKNIAQSNQIKSIQRLRILNQKYQLKEKVTLITSSSTFLLLKKEGWDISYNLTKKIPIESSNSEAIAQSIAKEIVSYQIKSLTFDEKLYPWIKMNLEDLLPQDLHYNIWSSLDLQDNQFQSKLVQNKPFSDSKVNNLFYGFYSVFEL